MEEIEKYIENLKKQPKLLSQGEIEDLIKNSNRPNEVFTVKNLAMASVIVILIAVVFSLRDSLSFISKDDYASYYEYRYASLVHNIQKKPKAYQTQLFLTANKNDEIPLHLTTFIEPSLEILNRMGFTLTETDIIYEANVKTAGYIQLGVINGRASVGVTNSKKEGIKVYDFYPLFLSETDGKQGVRFTFGNEPKEKLTDKFFQEKRDSLIPIVVKVPGKETKMIFWFLPTESLFEILDNGNPKPDETENSFSNTIDKSLKIYPNPTKDFMTIKSNLEEELIKVELLNINGESVKVIPQEISVKDLNTFYNLDIRNVPNGIYLLLIKLNNNSSIVKRIVKKD